MNKLELKGLKYYFVFCGAMICIYIYSMLIGWRFLSYHQSEHSKDRTYSRTYHHK